MYYDLIHNREKSRTDTLTGLLNYQGLMEILEREEAHSKRYKEPLTLGFIDFNNLKLYNDTYGHVQANHAIKSVPKTIKSSLREQDILARYGGDEFCIVLPNTNIDGSRIVVDRIIKSVDSLSIDSVCCQLPDDKYKKVTVSIGCTQLKENEGYMLGIDRASKAMKEAKANSREVSSIVYMN